MLFSEVIGQENIKARMLNAYREGRIPHAQLLSGLEGCGKMALALAYAQYLNCTNKTETDSCGVCPSCKQISKLVHPDLHFMFPFAKLDKKVSKCDDVLPQWRAFLQQQTYFSSEDWARFLEVENKQMIIGAEDGNEIIRKLNLKAFESAFKIVIIYLPEKMNDTCSNKILKILEEPFDGTVFLLVSEKPELLLSTILSRVQQIHVPPIDNESLQNALKKYAPTLSEKEINAVVRIANGNYVRALSLINGEGAIVENLDAFYKLFDSLLSKRVKQMKVWSENMAGIGRENQKLFFEYMQRMIREVFILNLKQEQLNYLTPQEVKFVSAFSHQINDRNVIKITEEIELAERHISQNVNAKMVFFDLALRMTRLLTL